VDANKYNQRFAQLFFFFLPDFAFLAFFKYFVFCCKNDFRQKIYFRFFSEKQDAVSDATSFFFFRLTHFSKTGCLFSLHIFHQNWPLQMLPFFPFFCLLSILCFVVKKDFRQKIYFRLFSAKQNAVSDITSFFLFHLICLPRTGCFFSCHMFHQNWLLQLLPFFAF
jgi:hypothetical protein